MTASSPIIIDLDDVADDSPSSCRSNGTVNPGLFGNDDDVCMSVENLPPSAAEVNSSKLKVKSNELPPRANLGAAANGFKTRPTRQQNLKKKGKKFLARRGKSLLQFGSKAQDKPRLVKHFRRTGPSYNFESKDGDINMLLAQYQAAREEFRRARRTNMEAFYAFRRVFWHMLCNGQESIDGNVPGISVGMCFNWRTEMFLVCLHRQVQAGIDWFPAEKSPVLENDEPVTVAVSVVVRGNYEDDVDEGEKILYCGEGGRAYDGPYRGEQIADQELTKGNLALYNSARLGRSVRVIRKHIDESSPSGFIYSYDGMYKVSKSNRRRGRSGRMVYIFELNRLPGQGALKW